MLHCVGGMRRYTDQSISHERAVARTRTKIPFRGEALEDIKRCLARDAKLRGQVARGGQAFARHQPTFDNTTAQLAIDLSAQVLAAANGYVDFHRTGIPKYDQSTNSDIPVRPSNDR